MAHRYLSRLVAAGLLAAGALVWTLATAATGQVAAATSRLYDDPRYDHRVDPGDGELAIVLLDAQLAAVVVMACGVAVLVAPRVRTGTDVAGVVAAVGSLLVAAGGVLTRFAGSPGTTVLCGVVLLAAACAVGGGVRRALGPAGKNADDRAGRELLVVMALLAVAAAPLLEASAPENGWVYQEMPRALVTGLALSQALLGTAATALLLLAAQRTTVLTTVASVGVLGGCLLLVTRSSLLPQDTPLSALAGGATLVGLVALAAAGGWPPSKVAARQRRRLVLVAMGSATAYALVLVPALMVGVPLGVAALALGGGALGADGLPLLLGGAVAGALTAPLYHLSATRADVDGSSSPPAPSPG